MSLLEHAQTGVHTILLLLLQGRRQLFGLTYELLIIHKHLCIFSADTVMAMATSSILHWVTT